MNGLRMLLVGVGLVWGIGCRFSGSTQEVTPKTNSVLTTSQSPQNDVYQCAMHPQIVRNQPGQCPICGMDLIKVKKVTVESNPNTSGMVQLDVRFIQKLGVRTERVQRKALKSQWRFDAMIRADERRQQIMVTRISGYVESLPAPATGEKVKQGQTLLELYSPEGVAAQDELLQALAFQAQSVNNQSLTQTADALGEAAQRRLANLGFSPPLLQQIIREGKSIRNLKVMAPISGILVSRSVVLGQSVMASAELFRIADLSSVWAVAQVPQNDMGALKVGMPVHVTFPQNAGLERKGTLSWISPTLNPETRAGEVRVVLPNSKNLDLKPEMSATLELDGDEEGNTHVTIPSQAVIRRGHEQLVIVSLGDGRFEPRLITVGGTGEDQVEVLTGLSEGETIVTSSQFLIDSESNLRAAIEKIRSSASPTP